MPTALDPSGRRPRGGGARPVGVLAQAESDERVDQRREHRRPHQRAGKLFDSYRYVTHGKPAVLLEEVGFTAEALAERTLSVLGARVGG